MSGWWRARIDPHDDPRIVEALSILDALDAKASGLGAILGLSFAANMVLVGGLTPDGGLQRAVLALAILGLIVQLVALGFAASCLFLMNARARGLLPTRNTDGADEAVAHFVTVTEKRTRRYVAALVLTFVSIVLLAGAIIGYAAVRLL